MTRQLVRERTDAIQAERKASQPYGIRSLGSVFKNPPDDKAGRLVEAAGSERDSASVARRSLRSTRTSSSTWITRRAADVLALVGVAHDAVQQQFGVDLEREIIVLGDKQPVHARA